MPETEVTITPAALSKARKLGMFGGHLERRLRDMVRLAAPFTHPEGNCRFEGFVLRVVDDVLVDIRKLSLKRQPEPVRVSRPAVKAQASLPTAPPVKGIMPPVEPMANRVVFPSAQDCPDCRGTKMLVEFAMHGPCKGRGCPGCKYTGKVGKTVPCPAQVNGWLNCEQDASYLT